MRSRQRQLLSGSEDGTLRLWDVRTLPSYHPLVSTLRLWDVRTFSSTITPTLTLALTLTPILTLILTLTRRQLHRRQQLVPFLNI